MKLPSVKLLSSVAIFSLLTSTQAAFADYKCESGRERDAVLRDLSAGNIRPDIVSKRLDLFSCFKDFVRDVSKEGWRIKPVTISLDRIAYGDEGHDQTYVIAAPLYKPGAAPAGPTWQIRKFHYHAGFQFERLEEIVQIED